MYDHPFSLLLAVAAVVAFLTTGCRSGGDPASFMAEMDARPAEQRPPGWEQTKARMARVAPAVGEAAPDFTLPTREGGAAITRSKFQADRPLFLVFGSFT